MSRFTMTLPSNSSMNYYEDNTAAQFTTKLAHTIELDGDWEVGLSSIGVPAEVENAIAKECYCNIYYEDVLKWTLTLPPGHYYRISHVIDALHSEQRRILEGKATQIVRFTHMNSRKRVMMSVHNSITARVKFEFSLNLARMIRFKAGTIYLGKDVPITGEKPLDLASNLNSFYVYCDLLQPIWLEIRKCRFFASWTSPKKGRYGLSHDESYTICTHTEKMFRYDTD